MEYQRHVSLYRPLNLNIKHLHLLITISGIPIQVHTYLTDTVELLLRAKPSFDNRQTFLPININRSRVKSYQREASFMSITEIDQCVYRQVIDIRHEHTCHPRFFGTNYRQLTVVVKLFSKQMSMCIYECRHNCNYKLRPIKLSK